MSLIHDALKSMDTSKESAPAVKRTYAEPKRSRPAWLDATLAFLVVVSGGVFAWYLWQSQSLKEADLSPMADASVRATVPVQPQPLSTTVASSAEVSVPAIEAGASESTSTQTVLASTQPADSESVRLAHADPAPATLPDAPARTKVIPSLRTEAPSVAAHTLTSRERLRKPATTAARVTPPEPVKEDPIELVFARFVTAMRAAQADDAKQELAVLKTRLPVGSLGLLRAQAWFDLQSGSDVSAAEGYRAILERMPGDEEAAINLASIQLRQHNPEEARATLDTAVRLQPDSTSLRAALSQFTPTARQ